MTNRKEELLDEYCQEVGGEDQVTIAGFLNFLVKKIQELEAKQKEIGDVP